MLKFGWRVLGEWPYGLRSRLCAACVSRRDHLLEELHGKPSALHDFLFTFYVHLLSALLRDWFWGHSCILLIKILQSAFL